MVTLLSWTSFGISSSTADSLLGFDKSCISFVGASMCHAFFDG